MTHPIHHDEAHRREITQKLHHDKAREHHRHVYFSTDQQWRAWKAKEDADKLNLAYRIGAAVTVASIDAFEAHVRALILMAEAMDRHWFERYMKRAIDKEIRSQLAVYTGQGQRHETRKSLEAEVEAEIKRELEHITILEVAKIGRHRGLDSYTLFEAELIALFLVHAISGVLWGKSEHWLHHIEADVARHNHGIALLYDFDGIWGGPGHPAHLQYYESTAPDHKGVYDDVSDELTAGYFWKHPDGRRHLRRQ